MPTTFLKARSFKGDVPGWGISPEPCVDKDGRTLVLASAGVRAGIVVTHSCELDKDDGKPSRRRVLIAPIARIDTVPEEHQVQILSQANKALLPLPGLPELGDCYADFRIIFPVLREKVDSSRRLASMTPEAELRLQAQLVAFFVRRIPE